MLAMVEPFDDFRVTVVGDWDHSEVHNPVGMAGGQDSEILVVGGMQKLHGLDIRQRDGGHVGQRVVLQMVQFEVLAGVVG